MVAALRELPQLGEVTLRVSCKTNPGVGGAHQIVAQPGAALVMYRVGAPGVCTSPGRAQKPPTRVNDPPLIAPASDWPMVPLSEYTPPVLVAPPPSIVDQLMENCPQA